MKRGPLEPPDPDDPETEAADRRLLASPRRHWICGQPLIEALWRQQYRDEKRRAEAEKDDEGTQ